MIIPTANIKRPYWISGFTGSGLSINKVIELMHSHQVYSCFIDCILTYAAVLWILSSIGTLFLEEDGFTHIFQLIE